MTSVEASSGTSACSGDCPCHSSRSSKAAKHCRVVYGLYITLVSFIYFIVWMCACVCLLTCAASHQSWGQAVCDAAVYSQDKRHSPSLLPVQILFQSKSLCLCACASRIERDRQKAAPDHLVEACCWQTHFVVSPAETDTSDLALYRLRCGWPSMH